MITVIEAKSIAYQYLAKLEIELGISLNLIDSETIEKPFGWVFFYNSKKYLETRELSEMLAGNAPFIVDKNNGEIHETGTEKPIEDYIVKFEKSWKPL